MDEPRRSAPLIAKIGVPLLAAGATVAYVWYRQEAANPPASPPAVDVDPLETNHAEQTDDQQAADVAPPPADDGIATSPTIITGSKAGPIDLDLEIEQVDQDDPEVPPFTFEQPASRDPQIISGRKTARILIELDDEADPAVEDAPEERPIIMGSKFGRVAIPRRRPGRGDDTLDADEPEDAPPADDDPVDGEVP